MTAPDVNADVRARFGFTISDSEPRILTWDGDNGCRPATDEEVALWDAHADMAREVTKLLRDVRSAQAVDVAERIRAKLPTILARTGNPLFDAGTHDACEKIEALLAALPNANGEVG